MEKLFCKKTYFANEAAAIYYIEKLHKTSYRDKLPVRAYLCDTCLNWHITSVNADIIILNKSLESRLEILEKESSKKEQDLLHKVNSLKGIIASKDKLIVLKDIKITELEKKQYLSIKI